MGGVVVYGKTFPLTSLFFSGCRTRSRILSSFTPNLTLQGRSDPIWRPNSQTHQQSLIPFRLANMGGPNGSPGQGAVGRGSGLWR